MDIRVTIDQDDLNKVKSMLTGIANGADKAMTRAINKSLVNVRTKAVKDVGKDIALKASRIKQDFKDEKARPGNPNAYIRCTSTPPGLINYGAKQTKKGVTVKVKRIGGRSLLPHAFIATMKGDNPHVVWRKGEMVGKGKRYRPGFPYGKLPERYRKPIEVLYGPRIADILKKPEILNPLEEFAAERMSINLLHEAEAILNRYA